MLKILQCCARLVIVEFIDGDISGVTFPTLSNFLTTILRSAGRSVKENQERQNRRFGMKLPIGADLPAARGQHFVIPPWLGLIADVHTREITHQNAHGSVRGQR